jgi:hypothetical protein
MRQNRNREGAEQSAEPQAHQQWQKIEETHTPQPNGYRQTVWEWIIQVIRGKKETTGDDRGEATRPHSHTPILPYAVGAAVITLLIIAFLLTNGASSNGSKPRQNR